MPLDRFYHDGWANPHWNPSSLFQYFSWCLFHLDKKTYLEKYTGKCFGPLAQQLGSAQNLIRSEEPVIQLLTTVAICGVRSFAEDEIFTVEEDKVRDLHIQNQEIFDNFGNSGNASTIRSIAGIAKFAENFWILANTRKRITKLQYSSQVTNWLQ